MIVILSKAKNLIPCHSRASGNPEERWIPGPAEGEARMGRQARNDKEILRQYLKLVLALDAGNDEFGISDV